MDPTPVKRFELPNYFAGGHIPNLHLSVRTGRGDPAAVGAERHAPHLAVVRFFDPVEFPTSRRLPELERPFRVGRSEPFPVGAEGHAAHRGGVLEVANPPAGFHIPDLHGLVPTRRGELA